MTTYVRPTAVNNNPNVDRKHDFYKPLPNGDPVVYVDFDMNLNVHPVTGDFIIKTNSKAIIQSLKSLILTSIGETLMDNEIGGGIDALLFDLNTALTSFNLRRRIEDTIRNHETRIDLKDVEIWKSPDRYGLVVEVIFYYANQPNEVREKIYIDRLR